MSFRLQIKGLKNSKFIKQRIQQDLSKVTTSLAQEPPDLSVVLSAEGGDDRYKCSINWMSKRKHGVHVEKTCTGAYATFRAALDALREASRRRSGRRRKILLGV